MRKLKNIFIAIMSVALVGFAINAFAQGGMGWGYHHRNDRADYNGQGYNNQVSQKDYEQIQQQRNAFFKETEGLRSDLFEKDNALRSELAKEQPDIAKASKLQKEVSQLQAQLDQKRITHMIEMRKLDPNAGRGFWRAGPPMGQGYGHMMDYGPQMEQGYGHHMRAYGPRMGQGYGPMMGGGHGHMMDYAWNQGNCYGW